MNEIFKDKNIIVTGHTGFKGSWLSLWLSEMGANVTGISIDVPTIPSNYDVVELSQRIEDLRCDINDYENLNNIIQSKKPDFIFHLAAQPLVNHAYEEPLLTFKTNGIGTLNVLESLRGLNKYCIAIFITSDKCYFNKEWVWGYKETDEIGGFDPYSGSKGVAELILRSYCNSFFNKNDLIRIGIGRAGNVIGGGDWAKNRIVPDIIKCWSNNQSLPLRSPNATRPWQHVLEPLSGYLKLAVSLFNSKGLSGEAFNFGPASNEEFSVLDLVQEMSKYWTDVEWNLEQKKQNINYESTLLKLNCDKAIAKLKWKPTMTFSETVKMTSEWYKNYYSKKKNILKFSLNQINYYQTLMSERKL